MRLMTCYDCGILREPLDEQSIPFRWHYWKGHTCKIERIDKRTYENILEFES